MIGKDIATALREEVWPHEPPVLTIYVDVGPDGAANQEKGHVLRAREAMRQLEDLPDEIAAEVRRRLDQEEVIARGRTMVVFAAEDLFRVDYLQAELPLLRDEVEAHWGKPYVAPLMLALDQKEHYALMFISQNRIRAFEVFMGEIEEVFGATRDSEATDEWHHYAEAMHSPAVGKQTTARGGADTDRFTRRVEADTERFHKDLVQQLAEFMRNSDADRIILAGTQENTAAFAGLLDQKLTEQVVARIPGLNHAEAPEGEWLEHVKPVIAEAEGKHELGLIDRLRETGTSGVSAVLDLLREGNVDILILPWRSDATVWYAEPSGMVSGGPEALETLAPEDEHREVRLAAVLPQLLEGSGARVEFVQGEAEALLDAEFGGMGALRRW